jgi:hypothetical protein
MIYGSTQAVIDSLRLPDGYMKTSDGGNLPIAADGTMMAGDVRAQENPGLTALQTLFVREHNHQVDQLKAQHPHWDGNHLYQEARAIVGAEIAHITYDEFLPKLLGTNLLTAYHGFDPSVDPRITEEFAGAAYRFGHSIVSDDTERLDNLGHLTGPEIELKKASSCQPTSSTLSAGQTDSCVISVQIRRRTWTRASSTGCVISWPIPRPEWTWLRSTSSAGTTSASAP